MRNQRVNLHGISITCLTRSDFAACVRSSLSRIDVGYEDELWVGVYASLFLRHRNSERYRSLFARVTLAYADGAPVAWLIGIVARRKSQRCATTDLWPMILRSAAEASRPVVLVGSSKTSLECMRKAALDYGCYVPYTQDGYWDSSDEAQIVQRIRGVDRAVVFVGMGAERQEEFAVRCMNAPRISQNPQYFFTVGGLFDHVAVQTPRAPHWVQTIGMEWLWRLAQEPSRLAGRYLFGNSYFLTVFFTELARFAINLLRSWWNPRCEF